MDIKTQIYYAKLSGSFINESQTFEGPIATIVRDITFFMATQVSLSGKHGDKEWQIRIQQNPFTANDQGAKTELNDLNQQAMQIFAADIPNDEPWPDESADAYYTRRVCEFGDTRGVAKYMTNLYFNPTGNNEMNAFRADPSAIRFLELDSGQGKDELAEEYGSLRNQLRIKYPNVWLELNLRRS
jgi:hypothetical protein